MNGIEIKNISLELEGASILKNVTAEIKQGEMVGLIGPNGAGKSSLIKTILGLHDAVSGDIIIDGQNLHDYDLKARAKKMAYAAQGAPVHWPLNVETIVGLGRIPHLNPWQKLTEQDQAAINDALEKTDTVSLKSRQATSLSGGERARVLLARVLATEAPFILADEPVAALDPSHQLQVMDILKGLTRDGGSVLIAMHDLNHALRYCDRLILLDDGKVVGQDTPEIILSDDNLLNVFGVTATRWSDNGESFIVPFKSKQD